MRRPYQRHGQEFKRKVVMEYMNGEVSMAQIYTKYDISQGLLGYWRKQLENGILDRNKSKEAEKDKKYVF